MATYWVCWLWLWKVRVLLDVEGLNFPIPPVVDHSKWDRSEKEESPSYHSIKAQRIESEQKIGFRHLSDQMSVGTIGRAPQGREKSALQMQIKHFEQAPTSIMES